MARPQNGTALPRAPHRRRPPVWRRPPPAPGSASDSQPVKVVPKGLRSFDAHDADFFLGLLPGPRDRDGLPESLRFWKTRVEEADPDKTFTVGLLYGPSGCGKSSLVKAGLLPRLARRVLVVYVEATAGETEARLLRGLRRHCPGLPEGLGLAESVAALRRGQGLAAGQKVLLVLDQFEQFLHARRGEESAPLVQALRQCDGERVQALVMVRDDFWMAVVRFMEELEVRVLQGENSAAVDLFDVRHARHVLAAFGRAYGALPQDPGARTKEQESFLSQAVAGLAQDGRVICVQLALFAEMVKGRPWTPATLKGAGGTAGVGVAFLEETFSSPAAGAGNRLHQEAARAVLRALLPERGADIKGHMRSREELLEASGYAGRPGDFEALLRLLDGETRLITPTEPSGGGDSRVEPRPAAPAAKYYQLTHDYLVPSLRDWLTRKQKETRRGRAELRLAERAAQWGARPEARYLPAWWEWLSIRLFTCGRDWSPSERQMMRKAGAHHGVRGLLLAGLLAAGAFLLLTVRDEILTRREADVAIGKVQTLLTASTDEVPRLIEELRPHRRLADRVLREKAGGPPADPRERLRVSLALLPVDAGQAEYLYEELLKAPPPELKVIRDALLPRRPDLREKLWSILLEERDNDPDHEFRDRRFRAACALAADEQPGANGERWGALAPFLVDRLLDAIEENPSNDKVLKEMSHPVRGHLRGPLEKVFRGEGGPRPQSERSIAALLLADYAGRPEEVIELTLAADENQFDVLAPRLKEHKDRAILVCNDNLARPVDDRRKSEKEKENLARMHANAGVILLRFGRPDKVWGLLRYERGRDPRARSHLIHRLSRLGVDPRILVERLEGEKEVSIRRALLLSLGEFTGPRGRGQPSWPAPGERQRLLPLVWRLYEDDDAGQHGAAEWLLRKLGEQDRLKGREKGLAEAREAKLARIRTELAGGGAGRPPRWYVNSQAQTMVVLPGPSEFHMGSPPDEPDRIELKDVEVRHLVRIPRTFALAAKEVTVEEFKRFQDLPYFQQFSRTTDCPRINISWFDAAAYCNWLSDQENLPRCYPDKCEPGMTLPEDYLTRTGYRLPTEAEWEYACRAGAQTSRFYGTAPELLEHYAWYVGDTEGRMNHPVGQLQPNDWGLFDIYGNVQEWCQNLEGDYLPAAGGAREDGPDSELVVRNTPRRVVRGDGIFSPAIHVRSAHRDVILPATRYVSIGLRPARTIR